MKIWGDLVGSEKDAVGVQLLTPAEVGRPVRQSSDGDTQKHTLKSLTETHIKNKKLNRNTHQKDQQKHTSKISIQTHI